MEYDTQLDSVSMKLSTSQHSRRQSRSSLVHTPKRHSARIEKPRSVHQSPRAAERRRTFTSTKQYASLEDHYRSMFGDHSPTKQEVEMEIEPLAIITRPFSWHPSSSRFSGFSYQMSQASASASSQELLATQDSSSFTAEPSSNDITNVYPSMATTTTTNNDDTNYASTASFSSPIIPDERLRSQEEVWASYAGNSMAVTSESPSRPTTVHESTSWLLPDHVQQATAIPQYPASQQDFLPIQHPASKQEEVADEEENELERQDSNVLVGMGLYDPPGSSSFAFGEGRCLKLEEEWEPPELPEDDDGDAEDEAEQESSSEDEEEEAPEPPKAVEKPWTMQTSVVPPTSNLAGQSFFFDDDDTITSEWWYQQLKQPTAQDAGIGYGWLQNA